MKRTLNLLGIIGNIELKFRYFGGQTLQQEVRSCDVASRISQSRCSFYSRVFSSPSTHSSPLPPAGTSPPRQVREA